MSKQKGGRRLTAEDAAQIRLTYKNQKITQLDLGKKYGVSREAINKILKNHTYNE
jgi:DNA-binding XRE family transcriptional regulator